MGPSRRKQRDYLRDWLEDVAIGLHRGEPFLPGDLRLQPREVESAGSRNPFIATRHL